MKNLGLNEIRAEFLKFFESKGHLIMPSFPLVPQNDNSLLLINAGMAPLKPYFTGKETPPSTRVTTCQKCIRTPDIERVGKTARHGTFFEMLGNFSFGDYFKTDAIKWAWEFSTEVMCLPKERLYVSVYEEDDETVQLWKDLIGIPDDHIKRLGKADNFWEIGTGPCGPCSEIYYDNGPEKGCGSPDCGVGCDCDRYVEFWNLVFTQFDRDEDGRYHPLARPNIDTGMGLERLACIMQGVNNLFEVDTVQNIMKHISKIADVKYGADEKSDVSLRVITDHIRSTTFMVCDGVTAANEGRGYVLKRLLRRAARHGKLLGIKEPFLYKVVDTVIKENQEAYPQLLQKEALIKKVIKVEEENFDKTVDTGLALLNDYIAELNAKGEKYLSGDKAFKLYDTYGFPIDLTMEILADAGKDTYIDEFNKFMTEQRERGRANVNHGENAGWDGNIYSTFEGATEFEGYEKTETEGNILVVVKNDEIVEAASQGDNVVLLLDKTTFYGESGGQIGDNGNIFDDSSSVMVTDTKKLGDGKILHKGVVTYGTIRPKMPVTTRVNELTRRSTSSNHTATHLLQKSLRNVLGTHVEQRGSYVTAERLRFDFTHFSPMTQDEIIQVEDEVNEMIYKAIPVTTEITTLEEAKNSGAMALFGEKYGSAVRMVKIGDYSRELCGGCHARNTAQIGIFKIISETSVASGVRRIEAITGAMCLHELRERQYMQEELCQIFKTNQLDLKNRINSFLSDLKNANMQINSLKNKVAKFAVNKIIDKGEKIGDITVIVSKVDASDMDALRNLGDTIKDKCENVVLLLASATEEKVSLITMASKSAIEKGAHAGNLIKSVAKIVGGGGGGRPDSAQAGGKDPSKVDEALENAKNVIKEQIGKLK